MRYTTASICLLFCTGATVASPFYFQTSLGTDGSGRSAGKIDLGVEVFNNDRFSLDLEAGYTRLSAVSGPMIQESYTIEETTVEIEPVVDPPYIPPVEQPDVAIEPVVVIEPIPVTEPEPILDPPPVPEPPPIVVEIEIPIELPNEEAIDDFGTVSIDSVPGNISINGKQLKQYIPKFKTDLYSLGVNSGVKIGNFMWLKFKIGVERKKLDGTLKEKGSFLEWKSDRKFSDAEVNYILGFGTMFTLRDQLKGVIMVDYRDEKNWFNGNKLPTSDFIYSAGLRLGF